MFGALCASPDQYGKAWDVELGVPMAGSLEDRSRLGAFVSILVASVWLLYMCGYHSRANCQLWVKGMGVAFFFFKMAKFWPRTSYCLIQPWVVDTKS